MKVVQTKDVHRSGALIVLDGIEVEHLQDILHEVLRNERFHGARYRLLLDSDIVFCEDLADAINETEVKRSNQL